MPDRVVEEIHHHRPEQFLVAPNLDTLRRLHGDADAARSGEHASGARALGDHLVQVEVTIGVLFGVNTVTGVWNLWESRKDPNGRTKRIVHSVLMLAADGGFVATAALAPDSEHASFSDDRGAHRAVAITSIGLATTSYLIMLLTR